MFRTDYDSESMPFVIEGEHTRVFGEGEVVGRIAVAQTHSDLLTSRFSEPDVIPVLLDEHLATDEHQGNFTQVMAMLIKGQWSSFVTFGSSMRIRSRRSMGDEPSYFMIALLERVKQGDFIAVVDNDECNDLASPLSMINLRSEVGIYSGMKAVLRALSPTSARIENAAGQN